MPALTHEESVELARLMREHLMQRAGIDSPARRWARAREQLVAAFGEVDIGAATQENPPDISDV